MAMPREPAADDVHDILAAEAFVVPASDPELHERHTDAHDVLAAEEFVVPAPDPQLHRRAENAPHDVLAAEEFIVPAPDPVLHHRAVVLPPDPTGIAEAHDVLAAEEFALPAGPSAPGKRAEGWSPLSVSRHRVRAPMLLLAAGLAGGALLRGRRRA